MRRISYAGDPKYERNDKYNWRRALWFILFIYHSLTVFLVYFRTLSQLSGLCSPGWQYVKGTRPAFDSNWRKQQDKLKICLCAEHQTLTPAYEIVLSIETFLVFAFWHRGLWRRVDLHTGNHLWTFNNIKCLSGNYEQLTEDPEFSSGWMGE